MRKILSWVLVGLALGMSTCGRCCSSLHNTCSSFWDIFLPLRPFFFNNHPMWQILFHSKTVNIFFVLPGEKHLDPEGFHASPTLTRSLSPSSYFSAPCLLHLFFSSFSSFSAAASSLSPENPSIVRILGQQRFFQFRQSYSCHIYKVLNPYSVIYKYKNKRNKCDQFIEMMQNSFPGLCNPRTNWGFFEIWRKVFEGEILCPSVRNAGYLSKEFLHIFTMRLRHWSP